MGLHYYQKRLIQDYTNFSLLFRRNHDGHIVSMHQAGTHWLRNLITHVIAREHGLTIPQNIRSDEVVGSIRNPPSHGGPVIVQTHSIPSPLFASPVLRSMLRYPKYLVLIRDPRVMLASHYKKRKGDSPWSFSDYLRRNKKTRQFRKNIWWDLRFLNTWLPLAQSWPAHIRVVKYEDLRRDTLGELNKIVDYFGIKVSDPDTLAWSVAECSKEAMSQKEGERTHKVVRQDETNPLAIYTTEDRQFFNDTYRRYLKADIGYKLEQW
jgi:hypothetical protein